MATVKDYETLVKKINSAKPDTRSELAEQKRAVLADLRSKCKNGAERRQLKFALDEANNS